MAIFTAKIQIELDEDKLYDRREVGYQDSAIIHEICDELVGINRPYLTDINQPKFLDCEIKE